MQDKSLLLEPDRMLGKRDPQGLPHIERSMRHQEPGRVLLPLALPFQEDDPPRAGAGGVKVRLRIQRVDSLPDLRVDAALLAPVLQPELDCLFYRKHAREKWKISYKPMPGTRSARSAPGPSRCRPQPSLPGHARFSSRDASARMSC